MSLSIWFKTRTIVKNFRGAFAGLQVFAFIPAITLGGYWYGGEGVLLFLALIFPAIFAITGLFSGTGPAWTTARDGETNLQLKNTAERVLNEALSNEKTTGKTTAAMALSLDDFSTLKSQYGTSAAANVMKGVAERLAHSLRETDCLVRLDGPRFGVALGPVQRADLETMIELSARLQVAISEPFSIDATRVFITASIGFCLPAKAKARTGSALFECAEHALETARSNGAGSIRAYSPEIKKRADNQTLLHGNVAKALEIGQISPWFQPQVSTNTGEITGFEALARWEHPDHGLILPGDFLPAIADLGLHERLSEIMLSQSLSAISHWEKIGLHVPSVSVNFSGADLSGPTLCEKIKWELDRFELSPNRLCVEILEDVIASSKDDIIIRNIKALGKLGCKIDLDDFGTGHASISHIRRFAVDRIKIDRSFITRVDRDRDQQSMVSAILTMAERLDIETLAEGVETIGEHAILAQLGCGHVQGFCIAKPMPFGTTQNWIIQHHAKLPETPQVGRKAG